MNNKNKKVIFITIGVGMVARNLLGNRFWGLLKDEYKIVIFTPVFNDEVFINEFGADNVFFEPLYKHEMSRGERFINKIHKALIYNQTVKIKSFYGMSSKHTQSRTLRKILRNCTELIVFGLVLSKIRPLRDFVKWIDRSLYTKDSYEEAFKKYKPSAVFVTNLSSNDEIYIVKGAKKRCITVFGMTKSWDNFSKISFREEADFLLVWSEFMKGEVMRFQNYSRNNIFVVGVPQFDIYKDIIKSGSRDELVKTYGLDSSKKIILFGQCHPLASPDDPHVVAEIKDWIIKNNLPYQILVRPHFGHKSSIPMLRHLVDNNVVFLDTIVTPSNFGGGKWDFSKEHHRRLALSLRYSDIVVTSATTLVLDSIASGNNVICYSFDKDKKAKYGNSIRRFYDTLWFFDLRKSGLEKSFVYNSKDLLARLKIILDEKRLPPSEYDDIIKRFCLSIDGDSGKRIFNVINSYVV